MNLTRLKFAYARGARIQVPKGAVMWLSDPNSGPWTTVNMPFWSLSQKFRIHPDDAHLEYGPLSSSLRESVINYAHEEQSKLIAAKYACGALGIDAFMVFRSPADTIEELDMFLLFCAELLADEGL